MTHTSVATHAPTDRDTPTNAIIAQSEIAATGIVATRTTSRAESRGESSTSRSPTTVVARRSNPSPSSDVSVSIAKYAHTKSVTQECGAHSGSASTAPANTSADSCRAIASAPAAFRNRRNPCASEVEA